MNPTNRTSRTLPLVLALLLLGGCSGRRGPGINKEVIPRNVYVALNLSADDTGPRGPFGRALFVVDIDTRESYVLPFTYMVGGPALGQPQHAAISPDKRTVYVTVGGDANLPLRLLTVKLDWYGGQPTPRITNTLSLLSAGAQGTTVVHAHGLTISPDGLLLFMSELLDYPSARLRVVDTRTNTFVTPSGGAFVDPGDQSLDMPHGFFCNPSVTKGMSTQYKLDGNKVTVWTMENNVASVDFGKLTHATTVTLERPAAGQPLYGSRMCA